MKKIILICLVIAIFFFIFANVVDKNKYYFITAEDKNVFSTKFENGKDFKNGIAVVKKTGLWGAIDKNGKEVIPYIYHELAYLSKDLYIAKKGSKYGVLFQKKVQIDFKFDLIKFISKEYILVKNNKMWTIIDLNEKQYFAEKFQEIISYDLEKGIMIARKDNQYYILNCMTKNIKKIKYRLYEIKNNTLIFSENGKYGIVGIDNNVVVTPTFDEIRYFSNEFAAVRIKNKWGFINVKGEISIPIIYDKVSMFKGNKALVLKNKYIMAINKKNEILFELLKPNVEKFWKYELSISNGMFSIRADAIGDESLYYLFTEKGIEVKNENYLDEIKFTENNLAFVKVNTNSTKGPLFGLINKEGNFIIRPKFVKANDFVEGYALVRE